MKYLGAFIPVIFFLIGSVSAQNSWFIDFGKSMEEVKTFLEEKHYLEDIQLDPKLQRIVVVMKGDKQIEYAFKNDKLFATSLSKLYEDRHKSKDRIDNCLNYLNIISNENVVKTTEGKKEVHTVITNSRVIKLFVIPEEDGKILQLAAFSRLYGDLSENSQFFTELQLLEKKLVQ